MEDREDAVRGATQLKEDSKDPSTGKEDRPASGPTDLAAGSGGQVLKRTVKEFKQDDLTDRAAALTYYGVLAIFPALLAVFSVVGLIGHSATQPLLDNVNKVATGSARDIVTNAIRNLQKNRGAGGVLFVVGLAGAFWAASGYIAAFMRASNAIYDVAEGRPVWKTVPVRVGLTVVLLVLLAVTAVAVVVTGGLARQVGRVLGIGTSAVTGWDIAKWPVLVLIVLLMLGILYWGSPNVKQGGFRWVSPGAVLALVVWLVASAGFALFVANFNSYNKTYGALAGMIIFLVWLWITNLAVLLGAEFNAELQRGRRIAAGHPAGEEPFLKPRDTRKMDA